MKKKIYKIVLFLTLAFFVCINKTQAEDINISDIKKSATWTDLSSAGTNLSAGYYELKGDYYFDKQITSSLQTGEKIYIDLNGHKLTYGGWANWEDEEAKPPIPPKYKGTVNAAFYGTKGSIYIFDSTKDNTVDIDFSLVEGFDNIVLKNFTYNASAWRNLIVTDGLLEIYSANINDINHAGAISLIAGSLKIKDADLKITNAYIGSLIDIQDSKLHFYTDGWSLGYSANNIATINNTDITTDSKLIYGSGNRSLTGEITITDSHITSNKENIADNTSISTNMIIIKNSSLKNIDRIEIFKGTKKQNLIENSELTMKTSGSVAIEFTGSSTYDTDIEIKKSNISVPSGALVRGYNNLTIEDSTITVPPGGGQVGGTGLIANSNTISITNSTIDTPASFISTGNTTTEIKIIDSNISGRDRANFIAANNATLIAKGSTIKACDEETDCKDISFQSITINSFKFDKVDYVGGPILRNGYSNNKEIVSEIISSNLNIYSGYSVQSLHLPNTKIIARDSSITRKTSYFKCSSWGGRLSCYTPQAIIIASELDFENVKIVGRNDETDSIPEDEFYNGDLTPDIQINSSLYWNNVEYNGGEIQVQGENAIFKNSNLMVDPECGLDGISIHSKNIEVINTKIEKNEKSYAEERRFIIFDSQKVTLDNAEIKTNGENKNPETVDFIVNGLAKINKLTYDGGLIKINSDATIDNSNITVLQDGSAPAVYVNGELQISNSKIQRNKESTPVGLNFIYSKGNMSISNSEILLTDKETPLVDKDSRPSLSGQNIILDGVTYVGSRIESVGSATKEMIVKNSDLTIYTKETGGFATLTKDENLRKLYVENSYIDFHCENKDLIPYYDGYGTYNGAKITTDTKVALKGKFTLDGETYLKSAGDYALLLEGDTYLEDVKIGENIKIIEDSGIFGIKVEEGFNNDESIPVLHIGFETSYKDINSRLFNFINPYHEGYRLRYHENDQNMYWEPIMKIRFIDRSNTNMIYFFARDSVEIASGAKYQADGYTYEFVGWFENEDGTGKQFISGESPEEDDLVYYAVWHKEKNSIIENPDTGAKALCFIIVLAMLLGGIIFIKNKSKLRKLKNI